MFHLLFFLVNLRRFKDSHFGQVGTINARYNSHYYRVIGDLICYRNRSKLVEGSLFAAIYLLLVMKYMTLYLIWIVGYDFHKKTQYF